MRTSLQTFPFPPVQPCPPRFGNPFGRTTRLHTGRPPKQAALAVALAVAWCVASPSFAQDSLALKPQRELIPPPASPKKDEKTPTFASGLRMDRWQDRYTVIEGDAEVRKREQTIQADKIKYDDVEDEVHATGNVRTFKNGDRFVGPEMRMQVDKQLGFFDSPTFFLKAKDARGDAKRVDFTGNDQYRLTDAKYTTCKPGDDSWYLRSKDVKLDYAEQEAEAKDATLYFKDVPIGYAPWFPFALYSGRRSGFLSPTFSQSNTRGIEVAAPFYWNIAPNRDMTITPRYMSRRGAQAAAHYRYLSEDFSALQAIGYDGETRVEYMPKDNLLGKARWAGRVTHTHRIRPHWTASVDINRVSDITYFSDLSNRIAATGQSYLPTTLSTTYSGNWASSGSWALTTSSNTYQELDDGTGKKLAPIYNIAPLTSFSASRFDIGGFDFSSTAEYKRFTHPTATQLNRWSAYPVLSYPLLRPGMFLIPKIGVHMSHYAMQDQGLVPATRNASRTVPVVSLDGGIVLERETSLFGKEWLATVEPRAFYSYIPFRDQTRIVTDTSTVFDTGRADVTFDQLFTENTYSGTDRFANTNQVTLAVSSRLLDPTTGAERVRVSVGQRFYFADQDIRTAIPGEVPRTGKKSDILLAASGEIAPKFFIDTGLQYTPTLGNNLGTVQRYSLGARYNPEPRKVISALYRYNRNVIDATTNKVLNQFDVSGQWPIANAYGGTIHAVGRVNYSISEKRLVESLFGLEFEASCWTARAVAQRYVTGLQKSTTGVFFQLELNDFVKIGNNPLGLLKRSIPGYAPVNANRADDRDNGLYSYE
jgi:LPS-assembly protein